MGNFKGLTRLPGSLGIRSDIVVSEKSDIAVQGYDLLVGPDQFSLDPSDLFSGLTDELAQGENLLFVDPENPLTNPAATGINGEIVPIDPAGIKRTILEAMGKAARLKRERAERKANGAPEPKPKPNIVFGQKTLVVKGSNYKFYFLFYRERLSALRESSNPDDQRLAKVVSIIEITNYDLALKLLLLDASGDSQWKEIQQTLVAKTETDEASAVKELESAVAEEFAKLFPDAPALPTQDGPATELKVEWERYKLGEINNLDIQELIGVYAEIIKPVISDTEVRLGSLVLTRAEVLELFIGSCRRVLKGFHENRHRRQDVAREYDKLQTFIAAHSGRGMNLSEAGTEAREIIANEVALAFFGRTDISQRTKEEMAIAYVFGGESAYKEITVFFDPCIDVTAAQKNPKDAKSAIWQIFFQTFGIAETDEDGNIPQVEEHSTAAVSLNGLEPMSIMTWALARTVPEHPIPERSLTVMLHAAHTAALLSKKLQTVQRISRTLGAKIEHNLSPVIRFLSDDGRPNWLRALVTDLVDQIIPTHPDVYTEIETALAGRPEDVEASVMAVYEKHVPYAEELYEKMVRARDNPLVILHGEQFEDSEAKRSWRLLVSLAGKNCVEASSLIAMVGDSLEVLGFNRKDFEPLIIRLLDAAKTFTADDWNRIRQYKSVFNPSEDSTAIAAQRWLFDKAYPPTGEKGTPQRKSIKFLSLGEQEGITSTASMAAAEVETTYDIFSRFRHKTVEADFPILAKLADLFLGDDAAVKVKTATARIFSWANGEDPNVNPHVVRTLLRKAIGDTLALRTLLVMAADQNLNGAKRKKVFDTVGAILVMGDISGDILCCVLRSEGIYEYGSTRGAKAELTTIRRLLAEGHALVLIPPDKSLRERRPDILVKGIDGSRSIVEVKSLLREDDELGYINGLIAKITDAEEQVESYARGQRKVIHVYVAGEGVKSISVIATTEVERELLEGRLKDSKIDEIQLIPVDIFGDSWQPGQPITITRVPSTLSTSASTGESYRSESPSPAQN